MSLTGDFARLRKLQGRFESLTKDRARRRIADGLAGFSVSEVRRGFSRQQSPDGDAWAGGPSVSSPILSKTGKLRGAFVSRVKSDGFSLTNRVRYAWFHQRGATLRSSKYASGPLRRLAISGPIQPRKRRRFHREKRQRAFRGVLPARRILPGLDGVPARWVGKYDEITGTILSRILVA